MDDTAGAAQARYQLTRVRDRWRIVAALAVLGAVLAAAWSLLTVGTTWTATTALSTQSQQRAPEQDAVLALGYVDYFNQDSYQELLRTEAGIPSEVSLTAEVAATSPLFYIRAVGPDENATRAAAASATETFRQDVRRALLAEQQRAAGDLQNQVDDATALLGRPGYNDNVVLDQIRSLQGRITDIQADNTNVVKQLQPVPGVSSSRPDTTIDVVTGGVGGAIVGVLLAFLLAALDRTVRRPRDLEMRAGIEPVVALDHRGGPAERALHLSTLANVVRLGGADRHVVAVVSPRAGTTAPALARELATASAPRRAGAMLVQVRPDRATAEPGLVEVLHEHVDPAAVLSRETSGLAVLSTGDPAGRASSAVIEPDRMREVVTGLSELAGVVFLDAPPLLEAAESQVVCAVADHVVLVVDRGATTVDDVVAARDLLDGVRARLTATVLDDTAEDGTGVVEGAPAAVGSGDRTAEAVASAEDTTPGVGPGDAEPIEPTSAVLARTTPRKGPAQDQKAAAERRDAGRRRSRGRSRAGR